MRELDQTHALKDKGQGIELVKWAFFYRGGASRNQGPKKDLPPTIKTTKSEPPAHCSHLRLLKFIRLDKNFDLSSYSSIPNRLVGQNKRAGGKILRKH